MKRRNFLLAGVAIFLTACSRPEPKQSLIPSDPTGWPVSVSHHNESPTGTIIVSTEDRLLYLVTSPTRALAYPVGVGADGRRWEGTEYITRKAEWPRWTPTQSMINRRPDLYQQYASGMPGGLNNPMGARALYLGNTYYRIHGTSNPNRIGQHVSNGCINMHNEHVIDLYNRVEIGTKVVVS